MKKYPHKVKTSVWVTVCVLLAVSVLCRFLNRESLTGVAGFLVNFFAGCLPVAVGAFLGLGIQTMRYEELPPEEQKEADRMETDERVAAIRAKAEQTASRISSSLWLLYLMGIAFQMERTGDMAYTVFLLLGIAVWWGQDLIRSAAEHWYDKRM